MTERRQGADATMPMGVDPPRDSPLGRFEQVGSLGSGGSGEVFRVRDSSLGRTVALKTIGRVLDANALARFTEEARIAAQLQHPSIVPVHEIGVLPDGRPYFTMQEVDGRTLGVVIATLHARSRREGVWATVDGWSLRRVLDAVRHVAEAVAYAHSRGVIHRDLKPSNVMVGSFGRVFVLDWGVAKVLALPERGRGIERASVFDGARTRDGDVVGTPLYMAPEQAMGDLERIGSKTDVWGLGAILCEALTGRPPVQGTAREVFARLAAPDLVIDPRAGSAPGPVDDALWELCARALTAEPEGRPEAAAFAEALLAWLDGIRAREQGQALVSLASARFVEAARLRGEAVEGRARAKAMLSALPPWATAEERYEAWAIEDEASDLEVRAAIEELAGQRAAGAALAADPALPEAHLALASWFQGAHLAAEVRGDRPAAAQALASIRLHTEALPAHHPERPALASWIRGSAAVTLVTEPEGAEVIAEEQILVHRRWVPGAQRPLGVTPLREVPLAAGSWILRIRAPGRPELRYPVALGRGEHWDGVAPGERQPRPIPIPERVPDGAVAVSPGWFLAGFGPERPPRRLWCDGLFARVFPVTMREICDWLDDLAARGQLDEAMRLAPRQPLGRYGDAGPLLVDRDATGRFVMVPDPEGDEISPEYPALCMDWHSAVAYAAWWRERTGEPWRLPSELEWEKAVRGVDGRRHPWGDQPDPSWCNARDSKPGHAMPATVDSYPVDCSPYGVRGGAGNVRDWTASAYVEGWGDLGGDRVVPAPLDPPPPERVVGRGGGWPLAANSCSIVGRVEDRLDYRHPAVGFRLVCSY